MQIRNRRHENLIRNRRMGRTSSGSTARSMQAADGRIIESHSMPRRRRRSRRGCPAAGTQAREGEIITGGLASEWGSRAYMDLNRSARSGESRGGGGQRRSNPAEQIQRARDEPRRRRWRKPAPPPVEEAEPADSIRSERRGRSAACPRFCAPRLGPRLLWIHTRIRGREEASSRRGLEVAAGGWWIWWPPGGCVGVKGGGLRG